MTNVNLDKLLNAVDISADWIGIRHVYEAHTPRMIRDGIPVMNGRTYTEGVMVEVLADGQFGYYGTPDISSRGIAKAAKSAFLKQNWPLSILFLSLISQLDQNMWDLINPHTLKIGCHYPQKS